MKWTPNVEAQKRLPSREVVLETKDNTYYHFKTDIFKREITYSTDKSFAANLITISANRAFDVINMNKKGMKPVTLEADTKPQPPKRDAQDILGARQCYPFRCFPEKEEKETQRKRQQGKPAERSRCQHRQRRGTANLSTEKKANGNTGNENKNGKGTGTETETAP